MSSFERGTSQVAIVLLQAFLCLQSFAKWSCNVVAPYSINSATMLLQFLTYSNKMSSLLA
jgi:hypothetical protein